MKAVVLKDLPVTILFSVSIYKVRDFWFDKKLSSKTATNRVEFDALKKEYRIHRSWAGTAFMVTDDYMDAESLSSEVIGLEVVPTARLTKGAHVQIRVKSQPHAYGNLSVEAPWAFKTDWYLINFIY